MDDLTRGLAGAKPAPEGFRPPSGGPPLPDPDTDDRVRCGWGATTVDYAHYHDREWGRPTVDERTLFEKMCLEGFQSGLSWLTILRKRPGFRAAFADFEAAEVARFGSADVDRLLADAGIVRHRGKIEAAINNAQALVAMWEAGGSLAGLIWSFEPEPGPAPTGMGDVPAQTDASKALAKELKRRGFRFVGPTTAYAAMQAMGVVDDHIDG
ncbi:MAG: DNA-3-methyladenine glycosylase I, partial [Actinomycetota bacterium]